MTTASEASSLRQPPRKRVTRNPKPKRSFELPDGEEDEREPVIGPGADPKSRK